MKKSFEYVCGLHTVRHALRLNSDRVLSVLVQANKKNSPDVNEILELSEKSDIHHEFVPKSTLDKHTENANHQGIVLQMKIHAAGNVSDLDEILTNIKSSLPLFLILDGIQDPHNLGACIRTANAAGVDAVIIPKDKSVSVTSAVIKVACGGVENTPVITVTNLSRTINRLQDAGVWILGADDKADKSIYEIELNIPLAIILGAEGKGMRLNTRKNCDYLASIPMHGIVESLNVSVATGICLYEALRQRH
jgi:23S rRNA (guanosine2251-2'-O)-methyltransferase